MSTTQWIRVSLQASKLPRIINQLRRKYQRWTLTTIGLATHVHQKLKQNRASPGTKTRNKLSRDSRPSETGLKTKRDSLLLNTLNKTAKQMPKISPLQLLECNNFKVWRIYKWKQHNKVNWLKRWSSNIIKISNCNFNSQRQLQNLEISTLLRRLVRDTFELRYYL